MSATASGLEVVTFTCPGKPLTWQRARRGRHGPLYTPADRESKMSEVRDSWAALDVEPFERDAYLAFGLQVFCIRPSLHYRANGELKEWAWRERPLSGTNGGDLDNFVKLVKDALNNVAYHDDAQIVEYILPFGKFYAAPSEMPRTIVTLRVAEDPPMPQGALLA